MDSKAKNILQELRKSFESIYGPRLVEMMLYGSYARGDAEPGSDIDVLIVLQGPVSASLEITRTIEYVADISLDYNEVIACYFISATEYEHENSPLLLNVRREGVPV